MNNYVVYFAEASNGLMKIGRSSNMPRRLKNLNNMSPVLISLFHILNCENANATRKLEEEFHRRFKSKNHHGEWFRLSKVNKKEIKKYGETEEIDAPYQDLRNLRIICPECGKSVKGPRGLNSHRNFCPEIVGY